MPIGNVALGGGSNWSDGEILYSEDLNDTFDAAASKVKELTTWWLNPTYLGEVWEDFEGLSAGSFGGSGGITFVFSSAGEPGTSGGITVLSGTNHCGGTVNELEVYGKSTGTGTGGRGTGTLTISGVPTGRHMFFRCQGVVEASVNQTDSFVSVSVGEQVLGSKVQTANDIGATLLNTSILVIAQSGTIGTYDTYYGGGIFIASGLTNNNIKMIAQESADSDNYSRMRINDIMISRGSVF